MAEVVKQPGEACDSCKFMWAVQKDEVDVYYECRCHAPQLASAIAGWPQVQLSDWCGEYVALVGADA